MEHSFSDFESRVKSTFDRWLHLSRVSVYQGLYDLIIKNKILMSRNAN